MMHSNLQDVFGEPLNSRVEWEPVTLSSLLAVPPCYGTMIKPHVEPDGWLDLRVLNIQEGRLKPIRQEVCSVAAQHG